jgi:hypothetical protein
VLDFGAGVGIGVSVLSFAFFFSWVGSRIGIVLFLTVEFTSAEWFSVGGQFEQLGLGTVEVVQARRGPFPEANFLEVNFFPSPSRHGWTRI